jgi:hypothetical protein
MHWLSKVDWHRMRLHLNFSNSTNEALNSSLRIVSIFLCKNSVFVTYFKFNIGAFEKRYMGAYDNQY